MGIVSYRIYYYGPACSAVLRWFGGVEWKIGMGYRSKMEVPGSYMQRRAVFT